MSIQVKRLLIAFALIIGIWILIKYLLTPESWGELGPYRSKAIVEIADHEAKYIEMETCEMCHDSLASIKNDGEHKAIQCETCHGPGYKHIEDPENNKLEKGNSREFCTKCHAKNPARPDIIKQIDAIEHNKGEVCITCHNPHSPWL